LSTAAIIHYGWDVECFDEEMKGGEGCRMAGRKCGDKKATKMSKWREEIWRQPASIPSNVQRPSTVHSQTSNINLHLVIVIELELELGRGGMMEYHRRITYPKSRASAIFDAYDGEELEKWRTTARTNYGDGDAIDAATASSSPSSSAAAALDIVTNASLGWRTRYSSLALNPVSIRPLEGRRLTKRRRRTQGGGDIELATFHMRQAFPRDRHGKLFSVIQPSDNVDHGLNNRNPSDIEDRENYIDDSQHLGTCATVVPVPGSMVLLNHLEEIMAHEHGPIQVNTSAGKVGLELIGANIVVCADGCGPFAGLAKRNKQTTILQWDCCVNDDDGEVNEPSLASDVGTADDRRMHHHLHHHYRQHTSCRGSRMFVCGDEMEMTRM
jgi:hypothetical protein